MAIQRSALTTGPAIVSWQGRQIYFKGGLTIEETKETFDIETDSFGVVDRRVQNLMAKVSGTPAGEFADLAVLFPYLDAQIGTRIHGASDTPLVITDLAGNTRTYHNAAISSMPNLMLSASKTMIGDVEWTCRTKDNTEPSAANSLYTVGSGATLTHTLDPAGILTQPYTGSWGTSPWDAFRTAEGFDISFSLQLSDITADGYGILDQMVTGVSCEAKFRPLVASAAAMAKLGAQGVSGALQGASLLSAGEDLVITGTGVHVTIYQAAATSAGTLYNATDLRTGDMVAVATRPLSGGVLSPVARISDEAPE